MRRPDLIETRFYIPVKSPLLTCSFQLAAGLIVARLESITSVSKKTSSSLNAFFSGIQCLFVIQSLWIIAPVLRATLRDRQGLIKFDPSEFILLEARRNDGTIYFVGWNKQRGSINHCDNGVSTSFGQPYLRIKF